MPQAWLLVLFLGAWGGAALWGFVGSQFADTLIGDGTANQLFGGGGDDVLRGGGGADILRGGEGSDTASYEEPNRYPVGIPWVVVNGVVVKEPERHTGALPGVVL